MKKSETNRKLTALVAVSYSFSSLFPSNFAFALTNNTFNPNAVNTSALKAAPVNCEEFCSALVGEVGEKKNDNLTNAAGVDWTKDSERRSVMINTQGGTGWGPSDDEWCAKHGYPTDPTVHATSTPRPLPNSGSTRCNVQMLAGDTDCKKTSDNIFRCQMHGSQVIPQCIAYKATGDAQAIQYTLLALNLAAAGTCAAGCAGANLIPAVALSCQGLGTAATVGELIGVFAMSSSTVQSAISGVTAAAGGASIVFNLAHAGDGGGFGIGRGMTQVTRKEVDGKVREVTENTDETKKQKDAMCASAIIFTIMAGLRAGNLATYDEKLKKDACQAVQDLASTVLTANPGPGGQGGGGGSSYQSITGGQGGAVAGAGGRTTGSLGGNGGADPNQSRPVGCTAENGCQVPAHAASTTDGGLLTQSNLDKEVSPKAVDIASAMRAGGLPAAAQSAFGGLPGEAAAAMSGLLTAAHQDASSLAPHAGLGLLGSSYTSGGGGGGGKSGGGAGDNPFANLFGGGKDAAGARSPASEAFGQGAKPMDIWHTGTTMNLFEIVSDKVSKVSGRVSAAK